MIKIAVCVFFSLTLFSLSKELTVSDLLSNKSINEAISASHKEDVRIVGGIRLKAPQGNIVYDEDLVLLAKFLHSKKKLPPLQELGVMLEDSNIAVRVFALSGLKLNLSNIPEFNPYFPPGHQDDIVRSLRRRIEVNPASKP
jgi:hypothetical protein